MADDSVRGVVRQVIYCPSKLVQACKQRLAAFRGAEERADDETLLAIQYAPGMAGSVM
jgi:serine phosphatase RsbU (regulator of sigma subunit)